MRLHLPDLVVLATCGLLGAACAADPPPPGDPYPAGDGSGTAWTEDLGASWSCAPLCIEPYLELTTNWPAAARDVDAEALAATLDTLKGSPDPDKLHLDGTELRDRLTDDLNLGFMLEGRSERTLEVVTISREPADGYTREELLLRDPIVGTIEALLLRPDGPLGSAIVGLHGHKDDAATFEERYLGAELARAGHLVLAPTLRGMGCEDDEGDAAETLIYQGFHLMSVRVYEALRMIDALRARDDVDPTRIGVLAHSGGSSTANILTRITDQLAAAVVDYTVDYANFCGGVHCETVPELFAYHRDINDLDTLALPHLKVPYAFDEPDEQADVLDFFAATLASDGS